MELYKALLQMDVELLCLPSLWFPLTPSGSLPAFHSRGSSLSLKAITGDLILLLQQAILSKVWWAPASWAFPALASLSVVASSSGTVLLAYITKDFY